MKEVKERIKAWAVVDCSKKEPRMFYGMNDDFHIFKTKKGADKWIDSQFFPAREMKWKARAINISKQLK